MVEQAQGDRERMEGFGERDRGAQLQSGLQESPSSGSKPWRPRRIDAGVRRYCQRDERHPRCLEKGIDAGIGGLKMKKSNNDFFLDPQPNGYSEWLKDLKNRIQTAQQRSVLVVNRELTLLYWQIGQEIVSRQEKSGWGAKVIERLAHDLRNAFPEMKGFSRANLMYMRAFAEAWREEQIVQQAVGQLPWGHNLVLITKLKTERERLFYAQGALDNGWSRNVLSIHIESRLLERTGKVVTNFEKTLPKAQSDLAIESLKDPYKFDFLGIGSEAAEIEIETAMVSHITQFLIELGAGFAYVGRQVHLEVGGDDFFIDLLFYHLKLRCYVVIEIKAGKFKPEHLGQLGFYLTAIDREVKSEQDNPTIGLLLCKSKNKVVAEYALGDKSQPMDIAEYKFEDALPEDMKTSLPTIEQIEKELEGKNV